MKICPNCENELVINEGFSAWCEKCEWNLELAESAQSVNLFERLYLSISRKHGESLFKSLVKADPERLRPTMSFSKFTAFFIAAFVHFLTLLFLFLGVWLFIFGWTSFFLIFIAIICLLIAWVIRPRFNPFPKNAISREDFPALYDFADSIAESLGAKNVDAIVINDEFNAAFGQVGLKNKKILYIGLPLWTILSAEEKTALISHELSHGINGDPMRGFFIGTAINSLIEWFIILRPDRIWEPENGLLGILMFPLNIFLLILSQIVWFGIYALSHLLWINSQKAEYLADHLATKSCGTKPMLDLLEKGQLGANRFMSVLHRVALSQKKKDLFSEIRRDILNLPEHEKERIRRIAKLEKSRLDTTHPPTFFRTEFLKNHFVKDTKILLSEEISNKIEEEISKIESQIQFDAIDKYKTYLYY